MSKKFEDLIVLRTAETLSDNIWKVVSKWKDFEKNTIGKQLVRAIDSVGANIAESYGRFHYGEKIQFLYYARGSLFESKFWLNRILARNLLPAHEIANHIQEINNLAKQLNGFLLHLKRQRANKKSTLKESSPSYITDTPIDNDFFK